MTKPRVAVVCTTYYPASHGDVIATKLLEGYDFGGVHREPRVAVASLYIEQADERDIGHALAAKHGVPVFGSIAEAMALGGTGMHVDGVVLIGEHGDYPYNAAGQHLYPRRRFFEAAIGAMVGAGRFVPLFNDKHLSYAHSDAQWMVDTARRLGVPLLAGSSLPLARRVPPLVWEADAPLREAVAVYNGPVEAYGFHALELLAAFIERRPGGETGVRRVQCMEDAAFREIAAHNRWDRELFAAALAANGGATPASAARDAARLTAFLVEYRDGLQATVCILHGAVPHASCAVRRSDGTVAACGSWLMNHQPYDHFTFLVRQIESLMLTGQPPYPVERTLLAGGILDAGTRHRVHWAVVHRGHGYRSSRAERVAGAYGRVAYTPLSTRPPRNGETGMGKRQYASSLTYAWTRRDSEMSPTPPDYTIAVVARTFDLLEALADAGTPLGTTDLARRAGTTKSATYRILATLEARGYVTKDPVTALYRLGPRFAALARHVTDTHDLRALARPLLEDLHRRFHETVNLGVCNDGLVVYIDMIESDMGLRMAAHLGARDYLHATSLGKALLASLPEEMRERFLLAPLPARTARTITDRDVLRAELGRIRREGVAEDRGENEEGSRCYGAPIFDDAGAVVAALSVSAPESRAWTTSGRRPSPVRCARRRNR